MSNLGPLNPQQRQAVETVHGPVLILAGAGTGKTRVITCRVAHLIGQGVAAGNILAVTFTNKAAREMKERVAKLVSRKPAAGRRPEEPTICTFHSFCARLLRQYIDRLGYKPNFVIYNESEQLGALKKILSHISIKGEKADAAKILGLLSRWKNHGALKPGEDPGTTALVEHVRRKYETALRACNAVDFDDLLLLTLRLFEEHPEVLEACRRKYRHVMVDEYQDTNAAQFRLVHLLTEKHRNLCVVGDDDQSIYGWRGAEIANLLDLERHFPEVRIIKLEQNYRSTNTILHAANALIQHNARRRGKRLWSDKGHGEKITLHAFETDEAEARTIVEEIEFARLARRVPWRDQAILFRTNQQSRALETALRSAGVRYHLVGGQSYFDRREVKDLLAYLKFFLNPHDDVSLLRIANVPARGLSDLTMERLLSASQERHCSVYAALLHPEVQGSFLTKTAESIREFAAFAERVRAGLREERAVANPRALQAWAERFLTETGYLEDLRRSEKDPEAGENRVRNLKDLVSTLDAGERTALAPVERLQHFLEEVTLDTEREEEEEETRSEAVTLITMHSCKGLEFPRVYVVGVEEGLLPHSRSKAEDTLDEERRLFYVAMTRAMVALTLSFCLGRKKYGSLVPCHPSRFLKELPPDLIERADEQSKKPVAVATGKNYFDVMRANLDSA